VTTKLQNCVVDLGTLEHIASNIPIASERCVQLRRSIAQASLLRSVGCVPVDDVLPVGIDPFDLRVRLSSVEV